jgi:MATE family multidrug resistance protein
MPPASSPSNSAVASSARPALTPLLRLAIPMVLARATQAVISFADTYQVSHLGADAIAATATGALNTYALVMLPMGTVFIVQTFVSQLVGRGERDATPRFAWYGLAISAIAGLGAVASIPLIGPVLGLFGYSTTVHAAMTDYMAIRALAVGAIVGTEALGNWYGGLGITWMSMVAGILAMVSNIALNAVLIDGRLGLPALGVRGTAVASSIASTLGFAFLFAAFLMRRGGAPRARATGFSRRDLTRVLRFGAPNGVNWFLEFAAFQIFLNVVISGLGTPTLAAFNVVISINMVAAMPAFGVASAGAILVAQHIGRGARDDVWPQTKLTLFVATAWQAAIGALYLAFPRQLLSIFATSVDRDAIFETGVAMLMLAGLWQAFDATAVTLAEALRAAGDTAWSATARLLLAWVVFVPSALYAVRVLHTGAVGATVCLAGYLALLAVVFAYRFHNGAWRSIELVEPALA